MSLSLDLKSLIDKSRRELDMVDQARQHVAELNRRMGLLHRDLDHHADCRGRLATRLMLCTTAGITPPRNDESIRLS